MNFAELRSLFSGKQHYFKVKLTFYPDPSSSGKYVSRISTIGLSDRADAANDRIIKKTLVNNMVTNYLKTYGKPSDAKSFLEVSEIYYLGYFKKPKGFSHVGQEKAAKMSKRFKLLEFGEKVLAQLFYGAIWISAFIIFIVMWFKK